MSLVKLAVDNETGYNTKRIWKSEAKGLGVGALIGAGFAFGAGKSYGGSGKQLLGAGLAGAGLGAFDAYGIGGAISHLKQNKEYAERHGSKHPKLQSLNPLTSLRMYKHTPVKESLKQFDPVGVIAGPLAREFKMKDQKPGK